MERRANRHKFSPYHLLLLFLQHNRVGLVTIVALKPTRPLNVLFINRFLLIGNLLGALFANQPYITSEFMKKLYGGFLLTIGLRYVLFR